MAIHITKKIFIFYYLLLILASCKSQKTASNQNESITYPEFRNIQKTFKTNQGNIKYIDKGKGKPILLLHGIPTSGWIYRNMINNLSKNGYRVIVPDMLGFGNSDSPDGYEIYRPEMHASRLLALMNHLKIKTWTHVMHDAGGLWTWELLKKSPNKIEHLIALNTIIYEEGFKPPIKMKEGVFTKFSMWLYKNKLTSNTMINKLFKEGLKHTYLTKTQLEGYQTPLLEGKTQAMYHFFAQTCNTLPNYETVITNINIPVAIIWGEHDKFLKLKPQQKRITNDLKIKSKNIHVIDAGHFIQEEAPKFITKTIINFIEAN